MSTIVTPSSDFGMINELAEIPLPENH